MLSKIKIFILISTCCLMTACTAQEGSHLSGEQDPIAPFSITSIIDFSPDEQLADYVVKVFEDSKGNLWFGTLAKGAARYDGKFLTYLTTKDGLLSNTVTSFAEDASGNLWLGTGLGLSKYDGKNVTNFTIEDDLIHDRVSNILIDQNGGFWIGTWGGVSRFDGRDFSNFPLPNPKVDTPTYVETREWVTEILEDRAGNIWISRSGYGVCKYDGKSFTTFTKKDGLSSNCVQAIEEDAQGDLWFGSRVAERDQSNSDGANGGGGLDRYDGKTFVQYPELKGLNKNDVYEIYKDKKGKLWISSLAEGAYKYDGKTFSNFKLKPNLTALGKQVPFVGIQSILEDKKGRLWFGCSGGLFRLEGTGVINITKGGPWE